MKKITNTLKIYGIWVGAFSSTFAFLHYLLSDGHVYWAAMKVVFALVVQATTAIILN